MSTPTSAPPAAWPERYEVTRRGTPDPANARYVILDVVNDFPARCVLRMLVRSYRLAGRHISANELERTLEETATATAERTEKLNVEAQKATKTGARSSRRQQPMS